MKHLDRNTFAGLVSPGRRTTLGALASLWALGAAPRAFGQTAAGYPLQPIRLLLPFGAGGSTDGPVRLLAKNVSKILKQPVIVEYRPGAGGTLAVQNLHSMPADGYSLAISVLSVYRMPYTQKINWNPVTDLSYIIGLTGYAFGIVVPANSPIKNMDDFVAYAKAHLGELSYSSPGVATTNHLTMEMIARHYGIKLNHIPYKGSGESLQALLSGQVQSGAETSAFAPHVEAGKLRLLAVWGKNRMKRFPDVPTMTELGLDIVQTSPWGVVGPKGLDPEIVRTLHDAFKQAMETPEFRAILAQFDMEPDYRNSEDFQAFAAQTMKKEKVILDALGLNINA